jgi:hypothetical protein
MHQFFLERKGDELFLLRRVHTPPHRRRAHARDIAGRQQ